MSQEIRDFPYYNGNPTPISSMGWVVILIAVVTAFVQLATLPLVNVPFNFIPAVIFTGLPLIALAAVTGWQPPAIFRRPSPKDIGVGLGFAALTITSSGLVGFLLSKFSAMTPNAVAVGVADGNTTDFVLFLARTFIQLVGEEVVTILPLLAVLWICVHKFGMARRPAILIAVITSTLWFAALHLPTYEWNILQCLLAIGTARVVLTIAYLMTRNIWTSSIAHILNDWSIFAIAFVGGHHPIGVNAP